MSANPSQDVKVVYEEQAYAQLQNYRNGLLKAVLAEINKMIAGRQPVNGKILVTLADVKAAFANAAKKIIDDKQSSGVKP
jgi:hypothetical protein